MKLKRFNELKSETYQKAAELLKKRGHQKRADNLLDYSKEIKNKSEMDNNSVLNDEDNNLEGYIYYNSMNRYEKVGLGNIKIGNFYLNTYNMFDTSTDTLENYLKLEICFYIDINSIKDVNTDRFQTGENTIKTQNLFFEKRWIDIDYYWGSSVQVKVDFSAYQYDDDVKFGFYLTRKGMRKLNKMIFNFFSGKFPLEIKWDYKSMGNFSEDENYNLIDYLYNFYDLINIKRIEEIDKGLLSSPGSVEIDQNYDNYFHNLMTELKKPKVFYHLWKDDFPETIKRLS